MHREGVMSGGWFQPRRLQFNETITYRCAFVAPQNPTAPPQVESEGPYRGRSSISLRLLVRERQRN